MTKINQDLFINRPKDPEQKKTDTKGAVFVWSLVAFFVALLGLLGVIPLSVSVWLTTIGTALSLLAFAVKGIGSE